MTDKLPYTSLCSPWPASWNQFKLSICLNVSFLYEYMIVYVCVCVYVHSLHWKLRYGQTKNARCVCACVGRWAVGECQSQRHARCTPEEDKWLKEIVYTREKKKISIFKVCPDTTPPTICPPHGIILSVAAHADLLSCRFWYYFFTTIITNIYTTTTITAVVTIIKMFSTNVISKRRVPKF